MKKSLLHLPKYKRDELKLVTRIIRDNFPDTQMLILFGSYARDEWVEDIHVEGHIIHEYKSDFDVLVITTSRKSADNYAAQSRVENLILNNKLIPTPVSLICHDIKFVNDRLTEGQYFFSDLKKDGVLLYDSKQSRLARRRKPDPAKRKQAAEEDFKMWFKSATDFYTSHQFNFKRRKYKLAAFELHQATERFYVTILLVFTGYRPRTHNIDTFGRLSGSYDPAFLKIFPRATAEQDRMFKLLKKAYVDARYKSSYRITGKELEYLAARVKKLQRLTGQTCKTKIESFA